MARVRASKNASTLGKRFSGLFSVARRNTLHTSEDNSGIDGFAGTSFTRRPMKSTCASPGKSFWIGDPKSRANSDVANPY
jgi:hypothetical protein